MNRQKINLTCYSSSGSSDEETLEVIDSKSNCDFLKIDQLRGTVSAQQNTGKRKFGDFAYDNIVSNNVSSDFWQSETREENWRDEMSVWGVMSAPLHPKAKVSTCRQISPEPKSLCKYVPKKSRLDHSLNSNPPLQNDKQKQSRGISFHIHDTIRPAIRKTFRDVVPNKLFHSFECSTKPINRINWCSADYSHLILSASTDSKLRIHDIFLKQCVSTITNHSGSVKDATWSNCGRLVASCGFDKSVSVTDVERGMQIFSSSFENYLTSVKFHPVDSSAVLTGSTDTILCWDTREPTKPVKKYKYKDKIGQILDICFLSDKEFLSSCDFVSRDSSDRCIMVWDFSAAAVISNEIFHEKYTCPRLKCHPFRKEFIAQTQGDYIAQFSSEPPYRMNKSKRYNCHKVSGYNVGCDINPNGGIVASGSADGQVVFYNYRTSNVITKIGSPLMGDIILDVNWHPVISGMCAVSTWSGRIDIWHQS